MGMFTTISDPNQGVDVQIKCGRDYCEFFSVGDTVPDYLPDGEYLGVGESHKTKQTKHGWKDPEGIIPAGLIPVSHLIDDWKDYWVIIKDRVIQKVFLAKEGP